MTALLHPHIDPPLVIEVPDDAVPAHVAAGWLLVEDADTYTDPDSGPDSDEENDE